MDSVDRHYYKSFGIFPRKFLWIGVGLLIIGLIAVYLYFLGGKPEFFTSRIFAVFSSYAETRFFVIAQTNLLDEIGGVFSLIGLFFMGFSKVKNESDEINMIRISSVLYSIIATVTIWILMFLFVYGWPIFVISFFVFYLFLIINFIVFTICLAKHKRVKENV